MTERSTTHVERAQAKLIPWFQQPKMKALVAAYVRPLQACEDLLWEIVDAFALDDAVGAQLNVLGRIVGQARQGSTTDAGYRVLIRARIRINRSFGRAEDIIDALRLMLQDTPFDYSEPGDATIIVEINEASDAPLGTVVRLAALAKAGGVRWLAVYPAEDSSDALLLSEDDDLEGELGLAEDDPADPLGGALADDYAGNDATLIAEADIADEDEATGLAEDGGADLDFGGMLMDDFSV